jgi:hypothetical protein
MTPQRSKAAKTATPSSPFLCKKVKTIKKRKKPSKGELNKIVDTLVHSYFEQYPILILADGAVHAFIEQDARTSIRKFVKYNASLILRELLNRRVSPHSRRKKTQK